jgi:hypothetical protein
MVSSLETLDPSLMQEDLFTYHNFHAVRKITIVGVSLTQPEGFYEVGGGEGNVQKLVSDAVQTNLDNREVAGWNEIFPDQQ